jgi:hypothetical protein
VKGWGYPFLGRKEERNSVKIIKTVSFDPFLDKQGRKPLKNRSNDPFGPIYIKVYLLFAFFAIFALFRTFLVISFS